MLRDSDWFVIDARNDNVTGPYNTEADATKMAADLSDFANPLRRLFPNAAVRGSFFPVNLKELTAQQRIAIESVMQS